MEDIESKASLEARMAGILKPPAPPKVKFLDDVAPETRSLLRQKVTERYNDKKAEVVQTVGFDMRHDLLVKMAKWVNEVNIAYEERQDYQLGDLVDWQPDPAEPIAETSVKMGEPPVERPESPSEVATVEMKERERAPAGAPASSGAPAHERAPEREQAQRDDNARQELFERQAAKEMQKDALPIAKKLPPLFNFMTSLQWTEATPELQDRLIKQLENIYGEGMQDYVEHKHHAWLQRQINTVRLWEEVVTDNGFPRWHELDTEKGTRLLREEPDKLDLMSLVAPYAKDEDSINQFVEDGRANLIDGETGSKFMTNLENDDVRVFRLIELFEAFQRNPTTSAQFAELINNNELYGFLYGVEKERRARTETLTREDPITPQQGKAALEAKTSIQNETALGQVGSFADAAGSFLHSVGGENLQQLANDIADADMEELDNLEQKIITMRQRADEQMESFRESGSKREGEPRMSKNPKRGRISSRGRPRVFQIHRHASRGQLAQDEINRKIQKGHAVLMRLIEQRRIELLKPHN